MNFLNNDWRDRRNYLNQGTTIHHTFGRMYHTIQNYKSDTDVTKKSDLASFESSIMTKIQSIPDPLKKNLADTMIRGSSKPNKPQTPTEGKELYYEPNIDPGISVTMENNTENHRREFYPSLTSITSFLSNVLGSISDAMFHRRSKSPIPQYYDCDSHAHQEMAPDNWQASSFDDQNKKSDLEQSRVSGDMNDCRATVAQVESKISAVRNLLSNKSVPQTSKTPKFRNRRPRRTFVEPGSVSDSYEEDITPDSYVSLESDDYVEYIAIPNNQTQLFCDIEAAKMKTELGIRPEQTDIVKILPDVQRKIEIYIPTVINTNTTIEPEENKKEVIASCEDKVAKLKAMLLERKKRPNKPLEPAKVDTEPKENSQKPKPSQVIPIDKNNVKRFKNPCRLTDKRRKSKLKKDIHDDMVFASEIDSEEVSSSIDSSPATKSMIQRVPNGLTRQPNHNDNDCFDETRGRFHSASDSDDSFQIVFSESPKQIRRPSDCDSEDSFIVFQDSPRACFTSNNLFNGHSSDGSDSEEESDTESDVSDSGAVCKLSPSLSRTMSDLTDNSLFDDSKSLENTSVVEVIQNDEVDCAFKVDSVRSKELSPVKEESPDLDSESATSSCGLLIDETKKLKRKGLPRKTVSFSEKPPKVHVMRVWSFAARQARAGHWERYSLDRDRFKRRIADVDMAISWVLSKQHRNRIMFQRFMPWWNKQKRIEAAEKKIREEEEKLRREEERIRKEREDIIEEDLKEEIDVINSYDVEIGEFINGIIVKEVEEKKMRAVLELKNFLAKDKKKMARKKERERKMESELSKPPISTGKSKLPNGILPLKC